MTLYYVNLPVSSDEKFDLYTYIIRSINGIMSVFVSQFQQVRNIQSNQCFDYHPSHKEDKEMKVYGCHPGEKYGFRQVQASRLHCVV